MAQQVKDPALSVLWFGSWLWHRFKPLPGKFCLLQVWPKCVCVCLYIYRKYSGKFVVYHSLEKDVWMDWFVLPEQGVRLLLPSLNRYHSSNGGSRGQHDPPPSASKYMNSCFTFMKHTIYINATLLKFITGHCSFD